MLHAATSGRQVAGCAMSARMLQRGLAGGGGGGGGGGMPGLRTGPTDEWFRDIAAKTDPEDLCSVFTRSAAAHMAHIRRLEGGGGGGSDGPLRPAFRDEDVTVAVDMHLIPRYDKSPGEELVRSKSRDGTSHFERYITMQCIDEQKRIVLGTLPVPSLEDKAGSVRKLLRMVGHEGVGVGLVLLDREFFATDVMAALDEEGAGYCAVQEHGRRGGCHQGVCRGKARRHVQMRDNQ